MGLFGNNNRRAEMKVEKELPRKNALDIGTQRDPMAEIEVRVSRLEVDKFEAEKIAGGGIKIGGVLVARGGARDSLYDQMLSAYLRGYGAENEKKPSGMMIGEAKDLRGAGGVRLSDNSAIALRDWLLKEFPLEAQKAEPKKKGK